MYVCMYIYMLDNQHNALDTLDALAQCARSSRRVRQRDKTIRKSHYLPYVTGLLYAYLPYTLQSTNAL